MLRRGWLIFLLITFAFGAVGVVYAGWPSNLHLEGEVRTANVDAIWDKVRFQVDVKESVEVVVPGTGRTVSRPIPPPLDVSDCLVDLASGESAQLVRFALVNAFPLYTCEITLAADLSGSVPVHITRIAASATDGDGNDVLGRDLDVSASLTRRSRVPGGGVQALCRPNAPLNIGAQLHDGDGFCVIVKVRVNPQSRVNHTYSAAVRIELTQWNLANP